MVAFTHGRGRVFLTSAHLEFDLTSTKDHTSCPESEKGTSDPECDWDFLQAAGRLVVQGRTGLFRRQRETTVVQPSGVGEFPFSTQRHSVGEAGRVVSIPWACVMGK